MKTFIIRQLAVWLASWISRHNGVDYDSVLPHMSVIIESLFALLSALITANALRTDPKR